jgi:hypothetical protein
MEKEKKDVEVVGVQVILNVLNVMGRVVKHVVNVMEVELRNVMFVMVMVKLILKKNIIVLQEKLMLLLVPK